MWRVREMAQQIKVLAAKPKVLSLIPGIYKMKRKNQRLQVVL